MALKFFFVPVQNSDQAEAELNRFLASNRVWGISREFVQDGGRSGWAIAIDHGGGSQSIGANNANPTRPRVDYREVLDAECLALYSALRARRKMIAEREAVPAYAIITNEQMARLAETKACCRDDLKQVPGFGDARVAKYGEEFLAVLTSFRAQASDAKLQHAIDTPEEQV